MYILCIYICIARLKYRSKTRLQTNKQTKLAYAQTLDTREEREGSFFPLLPGDQSMRAGQGIPAYKYLL